MDRLSVKRALGTFWRPLAERAERRIVLLYHTVGGGPSATTVDAFRAQMEFLAGEARFTSVDGLIEERDPDPLAAAISFDDGYASVAEVAFPILRDVGATAAVFVNTSMVAADQARLPDTKLGYYPGEAFLTWPQVERLAEHGWVIGSHGARHLDLTATGDGVARDELVRSKREIEDALGKDCDCFAYTWGRRSDRLQKLVRWAGCRYAFCAEHAPIGDRPDRTAIPRINIAKEYGIEDFRAIVRGDWDYLGWMQRRRNRR